VQLSLLVAGLAFSAPRDPDAVDVARQLAVRADPAALDARPRPDVRAPRRVPAERRVDVGRRTERPVDATQRAPDADDVDAEYHSEQVVERVLTVDRLSA